MNGLSWALAAAATVAVAGSSPENLTPKTEGRLHVVVPNPASNDGAVRIYLHRRETFTTENLKKLEAGACLAMAVVEIENCEAAWTTDPLPHGQYAIIVHHDVNGDGAINFGKILPREAVGYSNYDHAIASYPDFDKARVTLNGSALEVRVEAFMQGRLFQKYLRE